MHPKIKQAAIISRLLKVSDQRIQETTLKLFKRLYRILKDYVQVRLLKIAAVSSSLKLPASLQSIFEVSSAVEFVLSYSACI